MTPLEIALLIVATIEGIFMTAAFVAVFITIRDSENDITKATIGLRLLRDDQRTLANEMLALKGRVNAIEDALADEADDDEASGEQ